MYRSCLSLYHCPWWTVSWSDNPDRVR